MRTKTLLTALAALAAGILTSNAQVYSANVVGYASVATPNAGVNYLLTIPFAIGVSNGANEVFGNNLPEFSSILIWHPNTSSYTFSKTDTGSPTGWSDNADSPISPPVLPVGQGFFLNPSDANVTNVFSGAIAVNVGTSNSIPLPNAGVNYLVGCLVPYAGSVTNGNNSGGGPNLNGLPEFSSVLIWNPNTSSYTFSKTDTGSPTGWSDNADSPVAPPTISVGQGLFVSPSDVNAKWTTGL
ncbi:MAG TPA: hypothetical protein VE344_00375 [Methylomirabilota bacterium]|nr:hypothetical protein [Methylomirabilota bacterium]